MRPNVRIVYCSNSNWDTRFPWNVWLLSHKKKKVHGTTESRAQSPPPLEHLFRTQTEHKTAYESYFCEQKHGSVHFIVCLLTSHDCESCVIKISGTRRQVLSQFLSTVFLHHRRIMSPMRNRECRQIIISLLSPLSETKIKCWHWIFYFQGSKTKLSGKNKRGADKFSI